MITLNPIDFAIILAVLFIWSVALGLLIDFRSPYQLVKDGFKRAKAEGLIEHLDEATLWRIMWAGNQFKSIQDDATILAARAYAERVQKAGVWPWSLSHEQMMIAYRINLGTGSPVDHRRYAGMLDRKRAETSEQRTPRR
jgi:hypothetical protein